MDMLLKYGHCFQMPISFPKYAFQDLIQSPKLIFDRIETLIY